VSDEKRSETGETLEEGAQETSTQAGEGDATEAPAEGDDVALAEREDEGEGEGDAEEEAVATPAAIARRVAALGADDDAEAFAREEERKLAERRAAKKKGKKKSGLEAAASKKLAKIGTRAEPRRNVAVAADADPLIERTAKLSDWAKQNQRLVQILGGALVVVLLGVAGFLYYDHKRETEASTGLTKAVETQRAQIGEPKKDDDDDDTRVYFKTYDDRRTAALKQYKEVEAKFAGTGAAMLARLAEGSLLLDKRDAAGALAAFTDVKGSPLAAADGEVKGRALEGIGFAHELNAAADPAQKDKELDAALAAYKELEGVDARGFKELAQYHQARVLMGKGEKDKAKELLVKLRDQLSKPEEIANGLPAPPAFPFLKEVVQDRLHAIDPAAAPKMPAGGGSGMNLSPEQIKKLMEQMQKQKGGQH
jgi:hypothetical protein